jgi:hypothetical protein
MRMTSMVAVVASACLLAGACVPRTKSARAAGGTLLAVAGTALVGHMMYGGCGSSGPDDDIGDASGDLMGCLFLKGVEGGVGSTLAITGLVWLIAAAAAPSAPAPPPAPPAEPSAAPMWPPPVSPSRSPSAPWGSSLAFD